MSIKSQGGVFGRNPTFATLTVENGISVGSLTVGGETITGLSYEGAWNANTNTPDITASPAQGQFWIVSVNGSTNVGGITNWTSGDWALYDGSNWQRVEGGNTDLDSGVTGQLPIANGGTGATTATLARSNLGSGAVGDNLFTAATASAAQQAMDVEVGVDVQAYDAGLNSIAGLSTIADKMLYTTGTDTYATTSITSAGRAILDDADASTQRTTLGLGSAATTDSTDYATAAQGSLADSALQSSDIGVSVQGYDANILTSSDIGSTVQGYDADTAKLDTAQTFTASQTIDSTLTIGDGTTDADYLENKGDTYGREVDSGSVASPATISFDIYGRGSGTQRAQRRLTLVSVYATTSGTVLTGFALYTSWYNGNATLIQTLGTRVLGGSMSFGTSGSYPTVTISGGSPLSYKINAIPLI